MLTVVFPYGFTYFYHVSVYGFLIFRPVAETGENIDHCPSLTTAICVQGTQGITLIQHSNEACYITSRIRVGTNNHFNHSTSVFVTPARYDNQSTVVLGRACSLSTIYFMYRLHACILYMPRALVGFTGGLYD